MKTVLCSLSCLAAALLCAQAYENAAALPGAKVTITQAKMDRPKRLTDGSLYGLEHIALMDCVAGGEITVTLPQKRFIDHLVLVNGGGPDWSIPKKIAVTVDGEAAGELTFPNFFNRGRRFDLKREGKVFQFKIMDVYDKSPVNIRPRKVFRWGGFAELELNAPVQGAAFSKGNASWYASSGITVKRDGDGLTFGGGKGRHLAQNAVPVSVTEGGKITVTITAKADGAPAKILLDLFRADNLDYVTTREGTGLTIPATGKAVTVKGTFTVPRRPYALTGTLKLDRTNDSGSVTMLDFKVENGSPAEKKKITALEVMIPEQWDFCWDQWSSLGDYSWTKPGAPLSHYRKIKVPGGPLPDAGYYGCGRYRVEVPMTPGPAYKVRIGKAWGDDKTFFNGRFIGETFDVAASQMVRPFYYIPASAVRKSHNVLAVETAAGFKNHRGLYAGPMEMFSLADDEFYLTLDPVNSPMAAFVQGKPVQFHLTVYAGATPKAEAPLLQYTVRDLAGNKVCSGSRLLELPAGGTEFDLTFPLTDTGYYEIDLSLQSGAKQLTKLHSSFGILCDLSGPRGPLDDSPFGMCLGAASERKVTWYDDLALLPLLGIDHVRWNFNWDMVEYQKGKYDWTVTDAYVRALKAHNIKLLPILTSVPHWNTVHFVDKKLGRKELNQWERLFCAPDDRQAWANYCTALVKRYHNVITDWEIWNEPNHQSLDAGMFRSDVDEMSLLTKIAAKAIHDADPKAKVVGPALALVDPRYLREMGKRGVRFDEISYHPYRFHYTPESKSSSLCSWDREAGSGDPAFERESLLKAARESGMGTPTLNVNEFSWSKTNGGVTPLQQAYYLVRYHVIQMPFVKRLMWYDMRGSDAFLMMNKDKTPRPATVTFNVMVHFLRDAKFVSNSLAGDRHAWKFTKNGNTVTVCWCIGEKRGTVLKADGPVELFDMMGKKIASLPAGKTELFTLTPSPVYAIGNLSFPEVLKSSTPEINGAPGNRYPLTFTLKNPLASAMTGRLTLNLPSGVKSTLKFPGKLFTLQPGEERTFSGALDVSPAAILGDSTIEAAFSFNFANDVAQAELAVPLRLSLPPASRRDYLEKWLLCGPFPAPKLLEEAVADEAKLNPVAGEVLNGKKWFAYDGTPRETKGYPPPGAVSLDDAKLNGTNIVNYAFIRLHSPQKHSVILRLGSDDGIAVWLNGKEVWRNEALRGVNLDEDAVPVTLKAGWNTLLLKVSNPRFGTAFAARLTQSNGHPLKLESSLERK